MKRFVCLACLLALLLSGCSTTEQTPTTTIPEGNYTHGIYALTFKTKLISNHGVGNDWSFTYTYNDKTIESGYTILYSLQLFSFLTIDVEIREKDKIDDVGTGKLMVGIGDGIHDNVEITVTETNGLYKGNTAVWRVTCEIKMVGKKWLPYAYLARNPENTDRCHWLPSLFPFGVNNIFPCR